MGKSYSFHFEEKRRAAARFFSCKIINYNSGAAELCFCFGPIHNFKLTKI